MLILWLLKSRVGWPLILSKLVAAEVAIANNFLWNDLWTFAISRSARATAFCGCGASCAQCDLRRRPCAERRAAHRPGRSLRPEPVLANAIAIGVTTGWNFWMNKIFSWSAPQMLSEPAPISAARRARRATSARPAPPGRSPRVAPGLPVST